MTTSVLITSYSSMVGEMEPISSMVGSEDGVSWNEHRSTDLTARLKFLDWGILHVAANTDTTSFCIR